MTRVTVTALVASICAATIDTAGQNRFPQRLERYLDDAVKLAAEERSALLAGSPVAKLLEADETREVAVFGAIWIDAPMRRYVDAVKDIENFEKGGGFKVTQRISSPPRIEDFARLQMPDQDLKDLRSCEVGDCEVKVSEDSLRRFRTEITWDAPDAPAAANRLMQQIAFEYVNGYLQGGNDRLSIYRDNSRPTFVAREFRTMVDQMPELTTYMPELRRYLLGYPKVTIPGATSFLYWQETEFGLKPTIRISHLTIREGTEDTVVASKMLYASHYFWTGLELRALLPDPSRGPGFWLVTVNRSRSDGLGGFTGMFVRGRARSGAQEGVIAALRSTKERLERGR
jgi:hypothetical protein